MTRVLRSVPSARSRFSQLGRGICAAVTLLFVHGLVAVDAFAQGAPAIRLANISTRLAVGTDGNVLIAGFIITGSQAKKVLIRGLGPTLPVLSHLADPVLELHDSSSTLIATDNWRDSQENELKATTIPPRNDYESGVVKTLDPGAYTVILSGKGRTTGVGLVELYDLDGTVDSKLSNIATRGFVDKGDSVLIGGTIIVGTGTTNVLFRAIGPSLLPFGVSNALTDTTLELFNGQGARIAINDDWQQAGNASDIQATGIPPNDPREAAVLSQLSPGNYTAIVRGKNNTTGVGLVEAYQIN
ncbi:MAG: hypothetical protein ACJ8M4_06780 [Chthoniobacterales bacterium]